MVLVGVQDRWEGEEEGEVEGNIHICLTLYGFRRV